jgi:sugar (pentulose or hexulose) kinase
MSFIKGAVLDLDGLSLQAIQRIPFPEPIPSLPPYYREYDSTEIVKAIQHLLDDLIPIANNCDGIVMCSQMHDVIISDNQGAPLSNLISWQDQRTLMPHPSGRGTYFDALAQRISSADQSKLGNELRPGQPIGLLFWMAEQGLIPGGAIPVSLPDFLLAHLCGARPVTEITHGMSHGALNLETLDWHHSVIAALGLAGFNWPAVQPQGAVVGYLTRGDHQIPCYTPVGDYQCALVGALLRFNELSLNISTGSQVSLLTPQAEFGNYQTRPFFDGRFLKTITHIPAGRSLNLLVRLLSELAESQKIELADPWPYISKTTAEIGDTDLRVDLAFFNSSCGDHGAITGIREEALTVGHLFRGAFQNMADNYYACARRLSPEKEWQNLVFSGGLAQKIPILRELILEKFQAPYRLCPVAEDTLSGLLTLALVFSGRLPTVVTAMEYMAINVKE